MTLKGSIIKALDFIESKVSGEPKVAFILGSGLGDFVDCVDIKLAIPFEAIPDFPKSSVPGHHGKFIFGDINGVEVVLMQGRFHFYEGHEIEKINMPVRIMKKLGVKSLVVTNAAGGINKSFVPGDLMLIRDHINLMGANPLRGKNDDEYGPRFPDMSEAYSKKYIEIAKNCAQNLDIPVVEGVYCALSGPSYETPAEIRMLGVLGADAVGMSTVPEVISAKHCGLQVLGISCISNLAAGISKIPLNHNEVIEVTNRVKGNFKKLLLEITPLI